MRYAIAAIALIGLALFALSFSILPWIQEYHQRQWKTYRYSGDKARLAGDLESAEHFYQAALQEAQSLHAPDKIASSTTDLENIRKAKSDPNAAPTTFGHSANDSSQQRENSQDEVVIENTAKGAVTIKLIWNTNEQFYDRIATSRTAQRWSPAVKMLLVRNPGTQKVMAIADTAESLLRVGDYKQTGDYLHKLEPLVKAQYGSESAQMVAVLDRQAECEFALGNHPKAIQIDDQARALAQRLNANNLLFAIELHLVQSHLAQGQLSEASPLLESALKRRPSLTLPEQWYIAELQGEALMLEGKVPEAKNQFAKTIDMAGQTFAKDSLPLERSMNSHAETLLLLGEEEQAKAEWENCFRIEERRIKRKPRKNCSVYFGRLAHFQRAARRQNIAIPLYKWSIALREDEFGADDESLISVLYGIGASYKEAGDMGNATQSVHRARTICSESPQGAAHRKRYENLYGLESIK